MGVTTMTRGPVGVAGLWALNLGFWPVLVAAGFVGGWRELYRTLAADLDPVRRWLLSLPPAPPPVPLKPVVYFYPDAPE